MPEIRQLKTPLLSAMLHYVQEQALSFHTPGHKSGKGIHPEFGRYIGPDALAMDLTFVPGVGDLYEKTGPVKEAQQLAAQLYGADASYFLVNGTTGGIHAMIMATVGPEEKIILPRNVHRSVIGGLVLSGAVPVFVTPEFDRRLGISLNVTPGSVEEAIRDNPEAKAVLAVNPTYYGVSSDLSQIAELAHLHNMTMLVDEAHGPHLKFAESLPMQGLDAGADIVVQSTHKMLGALSQGSMLHCRGNRVDGPRLEAMLQLLQTSSPNYILMASLDAARLQMAENGRVLVGRSVELAAMARAAINRFDRIDCFGREQEGAPGFFALDSTKLTVNVRDLGISGYEAEQILRKEYHVQAELSDPFNLLFFITYADEHAEVERLVAALKGLAQQERGNCHPAVMGESPNLWLPPVESSRTLLSPAKQYSTNRRIDFASSAGQICAEMVASYPPGIPLLIPGELITAEMIDYCRILQGIGGHISGPDDPTLRTIRVVN